ncbi:MAG: hypothetical protein ACRDD1_03790, partial [Planctomycetia bacterium]
MDLTVTLGVLTADLRLSVTPAGAGFQDVILAVLPNGLAAAIADTEIRSVLSVVDTSSINASYNPTTGEFSSVLILSAAAVDAGFQPVVLSLEADGLKGQMADTAIRSTLSVVDTNSI